MELIDAEIEVEMEMEMVVISRVNLDSCVYYQSIDWSLKKTVTTTFKTPILNFPLSKRN